MKITYLIAGLIIGGILSFFLTRSFYQTPISSTNIEQTDIDTLNKALKWNWSDSLDAKKVAPNSHKTVYEDSTLRIMQVVLEPNSTEPVHTHKWRSVMWFTQATPMVYYRYGRTNDKLVIQDSIQIPQMPQGVLNRGEGVPAEEPHAVKNASNRAGVAYRVEFKKE